MPEKKKIKIGLLLQIVFAIALGIGCGYIFPEWLGRIFMTFNGLFSQFLGFLVPLIIVGFVTPAIADIGRKAGKVLVVTAAIAYGATIFAGFLSYFTSATTFPHLINPSPIDSGLKNAADLLPYFTVEIPPLMGVMTGLVISFMLGVGIAYL
ncbi:cation:dicarboxylase symporter family transporter, partial [uncultured Muribaculum sp.]